MTCISLLQAELPYFMPLAATTAAALSAAGISFLEDEPLQRKVFWRAGGTADGFITIETVAALGAAQRAASQTSTPLFVLGRGSNLLVSDAGVRGLVVVLDGALAESVSDGGDPPVIRAGAGQSLTALLNRGKRERWTGLECFAGIPGTVGGAVRMNAGTALGETKDALIDVEVVHTDGSVRTLDAQELRLTYRTCHLPKGSIIASARLRTTGGDFEASQRSMRDFLAKRKASQPLTLPSCGSTFRNPPGDYAGRLIEAAGLKGLQIGGAQVSPMHANFVVNTGGATAADIRQVIEHIQAVVAEQFGVALQREVHFAGDWSTWTGPRPIAGVS